MWVLEARKNAEKITYPVVWEEIKYADNVINYDIREEQTKDISAEINANNQTTTGMATVIPWVNAPKLLESTSIISTPVPWYIFATVTFRWASAPAWTTESLSVVWIAWQVWTPQYTSTWANNRFLRIPADWVYKLDITFPSGTNNYYFVYKVFTDEKWQIVYQVSESWDVWTSLTLDMKKWELISSSTTILTTQSWTGTTAPFRYMDITRLW